MCLLFLWQWGRTCVCLPAWKTWQSCVVPLDELPPLGWTLCQRCVTLHRCLGLWHPKPVVSLSPREEEWCHLDVCCPPALSWLVLSLLALELARWLSRWCHSYGCDAVVWEHSCGRTVHAVHVHLLAFRIHTCVRFRFATESDSLSPTAVIGGAWSQSPEWGEDAARSLAVSTSLMALAKRSARWFASTGLSQAFFMWWISAAGLAELDWLVHKASVG